MKARPLSILQRLFTHRLEPGDRIELDGSEEPSGRIGYTLRGSDGEMKSRGVTPGEVAVPPHEGSVTVGLTRGELELLSKIAWACGDLSISVSVPRGTTGVWVEGHVNDSALRIQVVGPSLAFALREFHEAIPDAYFPERFTETRKLAREAGVMVDPGHYWAKAHKGAKWNLGRVLSYESICGPAGTVWHGNEVVPIARLHQLGQRVPEPTLGETEPTATKPYRPPMGLRNWPAPLKVSAAEWNESCPPGTPVRYWPVAGKPNVCETHTRSEAWELGHGEPVVKVVGWSGGVALSHIARLGHTGRVEEEEE